MKDIKRFILPLLFAILGIYFGFQFIRETATLVTTQFPVYNMIPLLQGPTSYDATVIAGIIIPIAIVLYLVVTIPLSAVYILGNRIAKATAYDMNIMSIGNEFGGVRMIRRAFVPALFCITSTQIVLGLLPDFVFQEPDPLIVQTLGPAFRALLSVSSSLLAMPIILAIFTPTWLLNDSGIVYHLTKDELKHRRCPDTMGVGRYFSNYFGGFSLLAFPLTMAANYFYRPFIVDGLPFTFGNIFQAFYWTIGLPVILMAFIIPIILVNEFLLGRFSKPIQNIARKFGAKDIRLEKTKVA
ncbi:MAG: hypothetical protein GF411_09350 [Candidatus Lokiarchaeota archaeon]|nr:hypothetical protein [Candidatus Lokiarchaeota archaeon]